MGPVIRTVWIGAVLSMGIGLSPDVRAQRDKGATWDASAFRGWRSDTRITCRLKSRLRAGFRRLDNTAFGYVRVSGLPFVKSAVVGNITLRMGERLVLGRGLVTYAMSSAPAVFDGVVVSPSLSRWFGRMGAAIDIGPGRWTALAAVVGRTSDQSTFLPSMAWLSAGYRGPPAGFGVCVGRPLRAPSRDVSVVSMYASLRSRVWQSSAEIALWQNHAPYFSVRVKQTGAARWMMRLFRAPTYSSGSLPSAGAAPNGIIQHGSIFEGHTRVGGVALHAFASMSTRFFDEERLRRRRVSLSTAGGPARAHWTAETIWIDDTRYASQSGPETAPVNSSESELRFRGKLSLAPFSFSTHTIGLGYVPGTENSLSVVLGSQFVTKRFDVRAQVAAYALARGQAVFISQPGVGSFEWFRTVYGRGSNVSVRVRFDASRRLSLLAYYGEPWLRQSRAYLGVRYRVR